MLTVADLSGWCAGPPQTVYVPQQQQHSNLAPALLGGGAGLLTGLVIGEALEDRHGWGGGGFGGGWGGEEVVNETIINNNYIDDGNNDFGGGFDQW